MKPITAIPLCLMLLAGPVQAREEGPEMDCGDRFHDDSLSNS